MAARKPGQNREQAPPETPVADSGPSPGDLAVVGIGASAGGLDAFKKFFGVMPADSGMAFVLIQHLDPDHESLMVDLLARHTPMRVVQVEDRMPVLANYVYMTPPNKYLTVRNRVLYWVEPLQRRGLRMPIDFFLCSLAEDQQEKAIGIVLSGTGTEGTLGLKAIKGQGGMVMVQDPATAQYDGMPRSAIATGLVDFVLPVEKMPEVLTDYVRHSYIKGGVEPRALAETVPDDLNAILALLQTRTKRNFHCYKKSTLARRIHRRMGLKHLEQVADYLNFLRQHPTEVRQLAKDLMIGVTSFFRDPEAWKVLGGEVVSQLVRDKEPDKPIRVWVPGCSTGEEPYSIAMLLLEHLSAAQTPNTSQIFASDIDEDALEFARRGVYPESIAADVPPERLQRFFTKLAAHHYQVSKELRDSVAFAAQNLVGDPPFSKLDLIICRNLLIYLEPDVQQRLMLVFQFALRPGGWLFLGSGEGIGRQEDLFEPVAKKWRIYRRIGTARPVQIAFPIVSLGAKHGGCEVPPAPARVRPPSLAELTQQVLLHEYAPASVLVNRNYQVLYLYGQTGRYLELPSGASTLDLLALAQEGLRTQLRLALHEAVRDDQRVTSRGGRVERDGHASLVTLRITPIKVPSQAEGLYLVSFEDEPEPAATALTAPGPAGTGGDAALVRQLEHELQVTREGLQGTVEELETTNEELTSSNEELQSTNEELVTSQEELQSLNEELVTVNSQIRDKVEQLEATTNDLVNLLASTDLATIFLNTDFCIKRFNPASTRLLRLIPSDVGRPLSDITQRFADEQLLSDAAAVLARLSPIEKEVQTGDGRWYLRRILPYRTQDNKIEGVVVTFADVTPLKQAIDEARVRARQQAVVVQLGQRALGSPASQALLDEVVCAVADTLGVEYAEVLRLLPDAATLRLEAGVGWKPGLVGSATTDAGTASQAGYTLQCRTPVIVESLAVEERFTERAGLLTDHGVVSGMTVSIHGDGRPYGVLGAHAAKKRPFSSGDANFLQALANVLALAINRNRRDQEVTALNESLEQRVAERTALTKILQDVAVAANAADTVADAVRFALRRICEHNGWRLGHLYGLADDGTGEPVPTDLWYADESGDFKRFGQVALETRYAAGQGLPGRVFQTGKAEWVEDISRHPLFSHLNEGGSRGIRAAMAFPVSIGKDVVGVLEFFSDKVREPDPGLLGVMASAGTQLGQVFQRQRLQQQLTEVISLEQQRLGQELHDTVGQELTGIGMIAKSLQRKLQDLRVPDADRAAEIAQGLQAATGQVRDIARGLFPVEIDAKGLESALAGLVERTQHRHRIACTFECDQPVVVQAKDMAVHLFRIAQEAVTNAVKHAQAKQIVVSLGATGGCPVLLIRDDGVGMGGKSEEGEGMGLRIMRYRAALIGAALDIKPAEGGGTVVICSVRQERYHDDAQ